ncbi:hypothetical protein FZEAL_4507 [Fusarium zealandicum]|uniref:Uncharacterized protein n=1 Tax=Fusarium zealandicum TaxID=1053134 RepID=A0A8H4XKS5_9HYPO|nr:hypothetical protein FZEAL_4507 [Fusarium zealandicum]
MPRSPSPLSEHRLSRSRSLGLNERSDGYQPASMNADPDDSHHGQSSTALTGTSHELGVLAPACTYNSQIGPPSVHAHDNTTAQNPGDVFEEPQSPGALSENITPSTHKGQDVEAIHFWWWWEIGAAVLSLTCMGLIMGVLIRADATRLEGWPLSIQPNSIIAVLTTVAKTAMMVPITSCLSQLKWRHVTTRPRPLADLQVFDDASRGPWGSTVLIWKLPLQSKLGWALAMVTVIALGIEPSAQQILDFPVQERILDNTTASIGKADNYFSKGFLQIPGANWQTWEDNGDLPKFQASVLNALAGEVFQPYFSCPRPASRCEWPKFTSLGICGTLHNVTDDSTRRCKRTTNAAFRNCTYSIPLAPDGANKANVTMEYNNMAVHNPGDLGSQILGTAFVDGLSDASVGQFAVVRHKDGVWASQKDKPSVPALPEVLVADFRWCRKTYKGVGASGGSLNGSAEDFDSTMLDFVSAEPMPYKDGQSYYFATLTTPDKTENFTVTRTLEDYLPNYLNSLLTVQLLEPVTGGAPLQMDFSQALKVGFVLANADMKKLTRNLAAALTNQMRSKDPGDNRDSTTVRGVAYINEPFIVVRWEWFILPAAETLLMAALLLWSMLLTRKVPLLRTSVTAFLLYPLRGWEQEHLTVRGVQTSEKLDKLAEGMCGKMEMVDGKHGIVKHESLR